MSQWNPYAYSLGLANPNGPICESCEVPQFIETMSDDYLTLCRGCAGDEDARRAADAAESEVVTP